LIESDRVHLRVEAVIVRTQCVEDLPHHFETGVVIQCLRRRLTWWHSNWENDVAVVLALSLTHYATNGLDNIHHRIAWVEENDSIKAWNVHALRKTTGVGKNSGLIVIHGGFQPRDFVTTLHRVHAAIHMLHGNL